MVLAWLLPQSGMVSAGHQETNFEILPLNSLNRSFRSLFFLLEYLRRMIWVSFNPAFSFFTKRAPESENQQPGLAI